MADTIKWVSWPLLQDYTLALPEQTSSISYTNVTGYNGLGFYFAPASNAQAQKLVNLLPFKIDKDRYGLRARGVISTTPTGFNKSVSPTIPRGIFWAGTTKTLIEIWGTTLYSAQAANTYVTTASMGGATDGPGGMCEGLDASGATYVYVATVGKSVSISSSNIHTTISDGDYPASVVPMPVFLDGYIFIAELSTRKIYNSAVGDQTNWAASTFTSTESSGGVIVGLAKHHQMVVALCEDHIEFFQDAAHPAPNSPLSRVPEHTQNIGCINRATITSIGDILYFEGIDSTGQVGFFQLENFKITKISNPSIDAIIKRHGGSNRVFGNITSWTQSTSNEMWATAYPFPQHGKTYIALVFGFGTRTKVSTTHLQVYPAFLYDPEFKIWIELAANHYDASASSVSSIVGGWPFPYGVPIFSAATSWTAYDFILQNAYGGVSGTEIAVLAYIGGTDRNVDAAGGTSITVANSSLAMIQIPGTDFDYPGLKTISGTEIVFNQHTQGVHFATSSSFLVPALIRIYAYSSVTALANLRTLNLNTTFGSSFSPQESEGVYFTRQAFGRFFNNTFVLELKLGGQMQLSSIKSRLTFFVEQ